MRDADNSTIAKIFVAITKRDQEPDLSRSEIETILNGKMNTDVAERLLDVIFHGARDKIPTEEFLQLLERSDGSINLLRQSILDTLDSHETHTTSRAETIPSRGGDGCCSKVIYLTSHNFDGICLHQALLAVFVYRYHQFYRGEGNKENSVSVAKGAGLSLLVGRCLL